jgi:hypothetical protein
MQSQTAGTLRSTCCFDGCKTHPEKVFERRSSGNVLARRQAGRPSNLFTYFFPQRRNRLNRDINTFAKETSLKVLFRTPSGKCLEAFTPKALTEGIRTRQAAPRCRPKTSIREHSCNWFSLNFYQGLVEIRTISSSAEQLAMSIQTESLRKRRGKGQLFNIDFLAHIVWQSCLPEYAEKIHPMLTVAVPSSCGITARLNRFNADNTRNFPTDIRRVHGCQIALIDVMSFRTFPNGRRKGLGGLRHPRGLFIEVHWRKLSY